MAIAQLNQLDSPDRGYWGACQYISQKSGVLKSGNWVSLFVVPSEYAHNEALLLCEVDEENWITWIPDHGEAELCLRQFCPLAT
ncbi:MAG: hypothetical protein WBA93_07675 [Microcoleaceae cyanobacterium]